MKRFLTSKSFLTAVSVLSVLLIFALLCGGTLALLHAWGIVKLPTDDSEILIPNEEHDGIGELPIGAGSDVTLSEVGADIHASDRLLAAMPFTDAYYMKVQVDSPSTTGRYATGLYEIWRYGEKYRINHYRINGEAVSIMLSDGERVRITNFDEMMVDYEPYSPTLAFRRVAPFPDFEESFSRQTHRLVSHERIDNRRIFTYEYPLSGEIEEIDVYSDTGLLLSYRRRLDEQTLMSVNVITADVDFVFSDYMFAVD